MSVRENPDLREVMRLLICSHPTEFEVFLRLFFDRPPRAGALAGAGGADQRHGLSRLHAEGDMVERRNISPFICKAHVFKLDAVVFDRLLEGPEGIDRLPENLDHGDAAHVSAAAGFLCLPSR